MMSGVWDEIFVVEVNQVPGENKVELRPIPVLKHYHSHREGKNLVLWGLCAFNEAISQV
jgi:hypothetical protein